MNGCRAHRAPFAPGTKNTTLHELQTGDRSRATDIRAVDGWLEGNGYRNVAQVLFGKARLPDRGWKTHDLRSRTLRLVKMGLRLMRGGYRELLRHRSKDKHTTPKR
ncbi:DNA -binding domain-containing protein [Bradyrhizobium uaiense]|uniref:DUF2285 domain-containing protein n=1 Tax=Bradyrhizobium uaiense TaxID=2594946 RepID=A0A6P1BUQ5_9BRAD|nr:DUF2285 domain-containing protein [Bradyrhizobium uaiense]